MSRQSRLTPVPFPPEPKPGGSGVRAMFALRDAGRRWPFALRAGVCMGVPVLAGWAAGDTAAGLMATIGGFTALYGSGRPYLNRAVLLAVIAVSFALSAGLGIVMAVTAWSAVLTVTLIAMTATLLCNALVVGRPGAYLITLACAVGTALHAEHLSPWHTGLLVLTGGAFAWTVHMAGALLWPRAPEKAAVAAAGTAVAKFVEVVGTPQQDIARHWAALALHESWSVLVGYQPVRPGPDTVLGRLRATNRDLQLLFAATMRAAARGEAVPPAGADRARRLAAEAADPTADPTADGTVVRSLPADIPLGRPGPVELLRQAVSPESGQLITVARVGAAAVVAGAVGAAMNLEHAYWAVAAAVLMLHQGLDWTRTLQRSLERVAGTGVGLLVAAGVLSARPAGVWLALTVALLQFAVETCVVRNYALAVVFITPMALTIGSGGGHPAHLGDLLPARGVDTAIGCAVALAVYALTPRRASEAPLTAAINSTLEATGAVAAHLARGAVTTPAARTARRRLQMAAIALLRAHEAATGSSPGRRGTAERLWPVVVATQRLAYRTLAACWALEQLGDDAAREKAESLFGPRGRARLDTALAGLAAAIRDGTGPPPPVEVPAFLGPELATLHDSVVQTGAPRKIHGPSLGPADE